MNLLRATGLVLVTTPLAVSAVGAGWLARGSPARLAVDFAQPLVVATAWGSYGTRAFAWLACGVAASTLLLGFAFSRMARRPLPVDRYAIFGAAVIGLLGAAAWPFVFSSDVYAYAAYGALAEGAINPYTIAPATLHDAFLDAARWQWRGPIPVDVYGPAMLAISRAAVRFAGARGVGATLTTLRVAAACAFLSSVLFLDAALGMASARRRSLVLAAYALNPVVLWGVAEGHNDSFVALGIAAAAAAARLNWSRSGGLLAGLLLLLKPTGGAFALGFAIEALRTRRAAGLPAVAAVLVGFAVASALTVPELLVALDAVRAHGRYVPTLSAQGLLGPGTAFALAFAAFGWGLHRIARREPRGYAWLGIAAVLGLPNVYPWYALWIVPLALAAEGGAAAIALWIATIFALVRYLPDASGTPLTGHTATFAAAIAIAPLAIALAEFAPGGRFKKDSAST